MDKFFTQKECDRCGKNLNDSGGRTMSWFTEQCICMECSGHESQIRAKLPRHGFEYEGCGYIPEILTRGESNS